MTDRLRLVSWTPVHGGSDTIGYGVDNIGRVWRLVDVWEDDGSYGGRHIGKRWFIVDLPLLPEESK